VLRVNLTGLGSHGRSCGVPPGEGWQKVSPWELGSDASALKAFAFEMQASVNRRSGDPPGSSSTGTLAWSKSCSILAEPRRPVYLSALGTHLDPLPESSVVASAVSRGFNFCPTRSARVSQMPFLPSASPECALCLRSFYSIQFEYVTP